MTRPDLTDPAVDFVGFRGGDFGGLGYEALHPELKDVNPEDYPDIHKMAILADEDRAGFSS